MSESFPVHDRINVADGKNIYKRSGWWKAALMCKPKGSSEAYMSIYLWNEDDDGWKRKNKYEAEDIEAWTTDRALVDEFIEQQTSGGDTLDDEELPVSDYYTASEFENIYKTDGWWKSIVSVIQKGDYELNTPEVIVYVWQNQDDKWRRRQKYAIKDPSDWEEEKEIIKEVYSDYWEEPEDEMKAKEEIDSLKKPPSIASSSDDGGIL